MCIENRQKVGLASPEFQRQKKTKWNVKKKVHHPNTHEGERENMIV